MTSSNQNTGFKTDAFIEALKKNDEMNKGIVKKEDSIPAFEEKNGAYITDAFLEALRINEEMNKKYNTQKVNSDASDSNTQESNVQDADADDNVYAGTEKTEIDN